ncbi:N-acetyltransferase [Adhaeribacter aerolatus]|uniref:N-acetyltransferase n=1 Tax=Adhaeribacter aerolatus TaxID=670289 RepID=A0A512ASM3_9BACT|nr:GNAT family N-acetyltransferase [Adhaeribacter aerolatus]GEO02705.1 N-acetyltransferase [Adhaeribacter aerolatus]
MIREYSVKDKNGLLNLLQLNSPQYFAPSEEADFIYYLDHHREDYFVVEINGEIVGSGGINYFHNKQEARLSWDIIHPCFQGQGIGKQLTQYRINLLQKNPAINLVCVRTTQLVYLFYQKMGFKLETTQKDFWAPGFDLYQMELLLKD